MCINLVWMSTLLVQFVDVHLVGPLVTSRTRFLPFSSQGSTCCDAGWQDGSLSSSGRGGVVFSYLRLMVP